MRPYRIGNHQRREKYKSDERQVFIIMGKRNGFSLVEMMIVMAIMGILFAIAIPQWNRYRENVDLRTTARDIAADIADIKAKATSERLPYTITFNITDDTYQIARQGTPVGGVKDIRNPTDRYPVDVDMTAANFSGGNVLRFNVRGTTNNGSISLRNAQNLTATIVVNITGRTHVKFEQL